MNKNTRTVRTLMLAGIVAFLAAVTATAEADEPGSVEAAILAQGNTALEKMSSRLVYNDWGRKIAGQLAQQLRQQTFSAEIAPQSKCAQDIISVEKKKPLDAAFPFRTAGVLHP